MKPKHKQYKKKTLSRGMRKHIRRLKNNIRRTILDTKEQGREIEKLIANFQSKE